MVARSTALDPHPAQAAGPSWLLDDAPEAALAVDGAVEPADKLADPPACCRRCQELILVTMLL